MPILKRAEKKDQDSFFNRIYEAAKIEDPQKAKKALSLLLAQNPSVDVQDSRGFTPAAQLAAEGNKKAAELLRERGASVGHIARGAASGKNYEYAEELYNRQGASADDLAWGAAFNGDFEYAEKCRRELGASLYSIATGAAQGGHREYVEKLRQAEEDAIEKFEFPKKNASKEELHQSIEKMHRNSNDETRGNRRKKYRILVNGIAKSAAQSGDQDYAEELRTKHDAAAYEIALGAALHGQLEYAKSLVTTEEGKYIKNSMEHNIARGAAQGGHFTNANMLHAEKAQSAAYAVEQGAAIGGHMAYAKKLYRSRSPLSVRFTRTIARAAAERGDLLHAEKLYRQIKIEDKAARSIGDQIVSAFLEDPIKIIAKGILASGLLDDDKRALHAFAFIKDKDFKAELITALHHENFKLKFSLIQQAEKINLLMKKGMNYHQALSWTQNLELEKIINNASSLKDLKENLPNLEEFSNVLGLRQEETIKLIELVFLEKKATENLNEIKEQIQAKKIWRSSFGGFFEKNVTSPLASAQKVMEMIRKAEKEEVSYLQAKNAIKNILDKGTEKKFFRTQETRSFYAKLLNIVNGEKSRENIAEIEMTRMKK
ncbi:MAG: hypothetical protein K0S27_83 [Gammaproteobacteria bacterium]|jgi:hypothetical protein|nr:hypothetical protein [Gammaproteobacteria bacterium]